MNKIFYILFLSLTLVSCKKKDDKEPIRPVIVQTVKELEENPTLNLSGFSKSEKEINLSFRVGGLIKKLYIKVGDKLKKGQIVAILDDQDYILKVQNTNAALEESQAKARRASSQYKRIKTLYESESASRNELDRARALHEASKADVEKTISNLELAKKDLSYTTLKADKNYCSISSIDVEIYENVKANQIIATLVCGKKMEVEIVVPENQIANIYENQKVKVYFNAIENQVFEGTVTEVGVSAAEGTAFPVTILLNESHDFLRSGMAAKVVIKEESKSKSPIIIAPLEAVGEDIKGTYVYLFAESENDLGIAKKTYVQIGRILPHGIIIKSNLKAGDKIIVAGIRFLHDNKKVKLLKHSIRQKKKK